MSVLLKMFPYLSAGNQGHSGLVDTEHRGYRVLGLAGAEKPTDFSDVGFGEFCIRTSLPVTGTAFGDHVLTVVLHCAQEQMARVATQRIVPGWAVVTDQQSVGDRSHQQLPRHTMGTGIVETAITRRCPPCSPKPTTIRTSRAVYLPPEPFRDGLDTLGCSGLATARTMPPDASGWRAIEAASAKFTYAIRGIVSGHSGRLLDRLIGVPCRRMFAASRRLCVTQIIPDFPESMGVSL